MEIPKYWVMSDTINVQTEDGLFPCSCWGWSNVSMADAKVNAQERIKNLAQRKMATLEKYPYGVRALKEKVIHEELDADGQQIRVLTINAYGALIMNTAGVMFVDIDFPQPPSDIGAYLARFFSGLFGKKEPKKDDDLEKMHLGRISRFLADRKEWGVRIYRTFGGMRCIITNSLRNPEDIETQQVMEQLGSDPMYLLLCKRQKSFRARLTPKPWRCGMGNPNITFPFGDDKAEKRFTDWQKKYNKKIESYSTCRFITQLGNSQIDPVVGQAVKLHDQLTKATAKLPLA